jgi:hypothetical protein
MTMRLTALFRASSLLVFLGTAPLACAAVEGDVEFPSPPYDSSGLTTGCDGAALPVGRLRGLVYSVPLETRRLPEFGAMSPVGAICMDHLAVFERHGYPGFPGLRNRFEWFGVDFQGVFVVNEPGLFHFRLTSDDGSKLFVDDALVIDNDGFHITIAKEGTVALGPGPHTIRVPYWQGPGPMALTLEVARPGEGYQVFRVDQALQGRPQ